MVSTYSGSIPQPVAKDTVPCFRHEGEDCPRCDGSGFKRRKYCAGCGEPSGSISAGTGAPIGGKKGGPFYHVNCKPGAEMLDAQHSCLARMED